MAKKRARNSGTNGNYEVGYGRPPRSSQIKPGEVRNPFGRNGRGRHAEDLLLKVVGEIISANVNGEVVSMSSEEAFYRRLLQDALKANNPGPQKLLLEHISRRRPPAPAVQTAEEIAQQEAEQREKEALAGKLAALLNKLAAEKKALAPRTRFSSDLRPISDGNG